MSARLIRSIFGDCADTISIQGRDHDRWDPAGHTQVLIGPGKTVSYMMSILLPLILLSLGVSPLFAQETQADSTAIKRPVFSMTPT